MKYNVEFTVSSYVTVDADNELHARQQAQHSINGIKAKTALADFHVQEIGKVTSLAAATINGTGSVDTDVVSIALTAAGVDSTTAAKVLDILEGA